MTSHSVRTTLTLPADLLAAVDRAVSDGRARSRNELVIQALHHELPAQKRAAIDADLMMMARDPEYQAEALEIEDAFASADAEALRLGGIIE
jgi:metal-responsive CopG/Arc/MetJ family transcriptional regulator